VGQATVIKWATEPFRREQLEKIVESALRLGAIRRAGCPALFQKRDEIVDRGAGI
jgi:hypothetical protein